MLTYEQVPAKARDAFGSIITSGQKLQGMGYWNQTQFLSESGTANFSSILLYYSVSPEPGLVASVVLSEWMTSHNSYSQLPQPNTPGKF